MYLNNYELSKKYNIRTIFEMLKVICKMNVGEIKSKPHLRTGVLFSTLDLGESILPNSNCHFNSKAKFSMKITIQKY